MGREKELDLLIEKLHLVAKADLRVGPIPAHTLDTAREAAFALSRLRTKVAKLKGFLTPIVRNCPVCQGNGGSYMTAPCGFGVEWISCDECGPISAALAEEGDERNEIPA